MIGHRKYAVPEMDGYTNPEERAAEVIRQLDRFIREGRSPGKGMNYGKWQELALLEITNAVRDAEKVVRVREHHNLRLIFTFVSCVTTIGFWGGGLMVNANWGPVAFAIWAVVGLIMLISIGDRLGRRQVAKYRHRQRIGRLERISSLEDELKDLEARIKEKKEIADQLGIPVGSSR